MKTKQNVLTALLAGTLLAASGSASAATIWSWSGTSTDWAAGPILDYTPGPVGAPGSYACPSGPVGGPCGDNNMSFSFISDTIAPGATNISITEDQVGGNDYYNVGLSWAGGASMSAGQFIYSVSTLDGMNFTGVALDSIIATGSSGDVTKQIYADAALTILLSSMNSVNGARDPLTNYKSLAGYSTLYVVDTIVGGQIKNIFNEIVIIPVPATLALFGIGLLGLFGLQRKSANSYLA